MCAIFGQKNLGLDPDMEFNQKLEAGSPVSMNLNPKY